MGRPTCCKCGKRLNKKELGMSAEEIDECVYGVDGALINGLCFRCMSYIAKMYGRHVVDGILKENLGFNSIYRDAVGVRWSVMGKNVEKVILKRANFQIAYNEARKQREQSRESGEPAGFAERLRRFIVREDDATS